MVLALRLHFVPLSAFSLSTRRSIRFLRFCLALITLVSIHAFGVLDQRPGSLKIALKRTRPRQRFWLYVGRDCMTEGGGCQGERQSAITSKTDLGFS
jgi:hypothetical protein